MMEPLIVLLMFAVGAFAIAGGINFFWQTGWEKAWKIACVFAGVALIFGLSGMWASSPRHSWGIWTPVFVLMLGVGWLGAKYGARLWNWLQQKERAARDDGPDNKAGKN